MESWKIWVDTGGTFTDCIAYSPQGAIKRLKVLSSGVLKGQVLNLIDSKTIEVQVQWPVSRDIFHDFVVVFFGKGSISARIEKVDLIKSHIRLSVPIKQRIASGTPFEISSHEEVPVFAARLITETGFKTSFPPIEMKLGSTRGTNALLERKGSPTVLLITKGFKDLLLIGTQQRSNLFALEIIKESPLYTSVIEVEERIDSEGCIISPLSDGEVNRVCTAVKESNCKTIAIAFLNSYRNPDHEKIIKDQLLRAGYTFITASHEISSQIKILPRAETAVANAYLDPIIHTYISKIQKGLSSARIKVMTSAGGLVDAQSFYPKDSLLSGPAGGVVGAATAGSLSKVNQIVSFDMGGTSTDVSLYNKQFTYRYESKVGEVKILSPSLAIETIAAGGGSICDFDGYKLTVGPHSAGAWPGPACYGGGGPLTITDVNLLLGRADSEYFSIPLYKEKSEAAVNHLLTKIKAALGKAPRKESVLESFIQIANEKMAEAIKKVSVQQGYDPAEYTLLSFGGAGGQHACALAGLLDMKRILVPYDAGLLSAYGIGHANIEHFEESLVFQNFSEIEADLGEKFRYLFQAGLHKLKNDGYKETDIQLERNLVFIRFKGQESSIEIVYAPGSNLRNEFRKRYQSIYGHWLTDREIEVESIRAILSVRGYSIKKNRIKKTTYRPRHAKQTHLYSNGKWSMVNVYRWESLRCGAAINGPCLIVSQNSTTVVDTGWTFNLDERNHGILQYKGKKKTVKESHSHEAALELFSNRFTAIAQEMGALLQRTSFSVNVKERLDYSCALMDAQGYLVVNAPHIPVHLGSMGVCVREVARVLPMKEGDVIITNHPAFGGSHLPDVTLIKPVYYKKKLIGYVATRAHHAEIGGKKPGSMPANAISLHEEGVIISPTYLVRKGKAQWANIKNILTSGPYPTRLPEENMADLNGALAAVNLGDSGLKSLCINFGVSKVGFYMKALRSYASQLLHAKIKSMVGKSFSALERLDDGSPLKVKIKIQRKGTLEIDFSGSGSLHRGNLNATKAIVQSVILYVLRLWVNQPIAMNEGLMERVKVILPIGLLNPDFSKEKLPAVVGGNTEVSQRLTDTLLKALGLVACSQGTMNNFLFGNDRFGFYETICGGTGAGNGFNGTDATHSHMTNTRITDPEILELRYPVRLVRFEIRKGSGGKGKWNGGDGVAREVLFKETVELNILSQHRIEEPYGMKGGLPGKRGNQRLITAQGEIIPLKGMDSIVVHTGDRVVIETPGGGGYEKQKAPKLSGLKK